MVDNNGNKEFTMSRWYHFGLLHPTLKRFIMLAIALIIMFALVFYVVPFKYAVGVLALCAGYLVVYLVARGGVKA